MAVRITWQVDYTVDDKQEMCKNVYRVQQITLQSESENIMNSWVLSRELCGIN